MNEQNIREEYNHIVKLLQQRRLKEAIAQLEAYLYECTNWELRSTLDEIRTSYQFMLQYMKQGIDDPQRKSLYLKLLRQTWETAERGMHTLLGKTNATYYHFLRNKRRDLSHEYGMAAKLKELEAFSDEIAVCRLEPRNKELLQQTLKRHESANQYLFAGTWSNDEWTQEEDDLAHQYLASEMLPTNDLCLFTSAVTLSLLHCFDATKVLWLIDAYGHRHVFVAQRALVGLLLVLHTHAKRISLYPGVESRLSLLCEETSFGKDANRVYIQLLRSRETEKIDKKMREEIIPEMMKNVNLMRNMKYGLDEKAMDENDINPDWEKSFEESGLGDKIREMNELQMEGADVYMSSFAQLKHFPFFNEPHNWFYPFDKLHSAVVNEFGLDSESENSMLSLLLQSGFFCNSDKYSLCFIMAQIPSSQRSMMLNQMTQQNLNEMMDNEKSAALMKFAQRPEVVSNQYIHDLYRFFKLSRLRNELHNPFDDEIALHCIPALQAVLQQPQHLKEVADFHFKKQHYPEAAALYKKLTTDLQDADLYQKLGFCLQKEKRYREAIDTYRMADVLKPDHIWTLRHLATCCRLGRNYKEAIDYYKKVEEMQPENVNILFFIGTCLAELERYDEALQYFFKLDFMEENNLKAWRAIGWCSFVCGKHEQAMRYYNRLLAEVPTSTDYLNTGHTAWVLGQLQQAVEYYAKAILTEGNRATFLEMFEKDKEFLLQKGIAEDDIPLVLDMIL